MEIGGFVLIRLTIHMYFLFFADDGLGSIFCIWSRCTPHLFSFATYVSLVGN